MEFRATGGDRGGFGSGSRPWSSSCAFSFAESGLGSMIGAPHRVFVADDHALFREGVKALLAEESISGGRRAGPAKETLQEGAHPRNGMFCCWTINSRRFGHRSIAPDSSHKPTMTSDSVDASGEQFAVACCGLGERVLTRTRSGAVVKLSARANGRK